MNVAKLFSPKHDCPVKVIDPDGMLEEQCVFLQPLPPRAVLPTEW